MIKTKLTIKEALENNNECFLILKCKDGDFIHSEVHQSSCYINSDNDDSFQTDFGYEFSDSKSVENYFFNEYDEIYVFEDEDYCEQYWEFELILGDW